MLIRFSKNPFMAAMGVIFYHKINISVFIFISFLAWLTRHYFQIPWISLPVLPVSILGGALAIFLAFRNNAAYDRWWEARKIWGGIVNNSRSFGMEVNSFFGLHGNENLGIEKIKDLKKELVYTHIGWLYSFSLSLRKVSSGTNYEDFLTEKDKENLKGINNIPQMIIQFQGIRIKKALDEDIITEFQHNELNRVLTEFYNLQGAAERIKNTVFPYYYNFFTRVFLWIFIAILPFTLIQNMEAGAIPISLAISFVFYIIDQSGEVTEDPFENRAADTPITALCRTIEIDLLQQLGEENIPSPIQPEITKFGGLFIR